MAHDPRSAADRREFLQTTALGMATAASLAATGSTASAQEPKPDDAPATPTPVVPRRVLGKTGVSVTMLEQGAVRGPSLDNILRFAFANGIRAFDTAKVYGSEPNFKKWFDRVPEIRKQIFLVTKDMPKRSSELLKMVDERLATLGTDYIDLFFVHGLGDEHTLDAAINLVTDDEFKTTAEALKKSGKVKFVGFSSHHKDRAPIIQAAAEAGYIDAVMLQYRPWIDKEAPLHKALDVAWKKGVGLISMKQIAGQFFGDKPQGNILDEVVERVTVLKERNLTPFQGLLHAIWTDERISMSCVSMRNIDQIRQNVDAARRFEPLKEAHLRELRDAAIACGPMLCADCDGRCSIAACTAAELGNLTRFLTYHQHHGDRAEARRQYARLAPEARDWAGADLVAARRACPSRLDFARLLPEVDRHLA